MKPTYEHVDPALGSSFLFREINLPAFDAPYHFHPEIELTLILESRGKRFVGTNIADFEPGDLVLLGANLPHCWRNDGSDSPAHALVVQFRDDFMGPDFWQKPELVPVARLLERAKSGLHFRGKIAGRIAGELQYLRHVGPLQRLLGLIDLLHTLAGADDVEVLDSSQFFTSLPRTDYERLNKIYAYVTEHFREEIRLETVSALVSMTPQSFCRYFRKVTKKTFIDLLNEYRIRYAGQLLLHDGDKTVAEICYQSGFGNISHFNRQFRELTGRTPLQYRKEFVSA
jgi:AraC-like DNA-binding protein